MFLVSKFMNLTPANIKEYQATFSRFLSHLTYFQALILRKSLIIMNWLGRESNPRHEDFQSSALPTELPSRKTVTLLPAILGASLSDKKFTGNAWFMDEAKKRREIH